MSTRIAVSLWDSDFFSSDKLVAHTYFDYRDVPELDQDASGGGGMFGGGRQVCMVAARVRPRPT